MSLSFDVTGGGISWGDAMKLKSGFHYKLREHKNSGKSSRVTTDHNIIELHWAFNTGCASRRRERPAVGSH